ncbi:MAG: hypothetical protein NTY19_47720 [Planctomycetota bacterium]|nr:hypothetical protein [Planctomycetota bacterium]
MKPSLTRLQRREFLTTTAAVACPYVTPSRVLAWHGQLGANDRLTLGHIGVGGMGGTQCHLLCSGTARAVRYYSRKTGRLAPLR